MKKLFPYILVVTLCVAAYIFCLKTAEKTVVSQNIYYTTDARDVTMVWGINYLLLPEKKYWPPNSIEKDKLVHTKLTATGDAYNVRLSLPANTILNYWMVSRQADEHGVISEVWDAGGDDKPYYSLSFKNSSSFRPGIFIFLAGFLPLLFHYFSNRKHGIEVSSPPSVELPRYIPQLDALRAIAVFLVIIFHFAPEGSQLNRLQTGRLGVNMFFVLSGFLITGILLRARIEIENKRIRRGEVFRNFYARRTLRIFPIYYLFLIIFWALNNSEIRENAFYYFSYTSNFLFYSEQYFPGNFSHLWSLGVEEQFYLVWPWVIVFAGSRILPYIIGVFLVAGISSNYIFTDHGWWSVILTPACFDAFAVGGFLSWLIIYRPAAIDRIRKNYNLLLLAAGAVFAYSLFRDPVLPIRTVHSFLAVIIIFYCLFIRNNRITNSILNNKWLIKMGKISYGIYLYHLVVPLIWKSVNDWFNAKGIDWFFNQSVPGEIRPYWIFLQEFCVVILIAAVSWSVIEKPINDLKRKFANKTA